ncbi:MAG: ribosome biogenesis GTP-binding protein YihA/YsxC [bacterium]
MPPEMGLPEVAFAGKSNVGKSSLINVFTRTRALARTSRTPGRTQQVNFFSGPSPIALADLPGYGFARAPAAVRAAWRPMVERYVAERVELCCVVVIIDARRGVGDGDRLMMEFGEAHGRDVVVVASKIDKLKRNARDKALAAMRKEVDEVFPFSALSREGIDEIRARLERYGRSSN